MLAIDGKAISAAAPQALFDLLNTEPASNVTPIILVDYQDYH